MKILLDMNLSPLWVGFLSSNGWPAAHWAEIGDPRASDAQILEYASREGYLIFTKDLDFGALLATRGLNAPSILQARAADVLPDSLGPQVLTALELAREHWEHGVMITLDARSRRIRLLPLRS